MKLLVKVNKNRIKTYLVGGILFFLIARIVTLPNQLLGIYGKLSQLAFLCIVFIFIWKYKKVKYKTKEIVDVKFLIQLLILYFIVFLSTFFNSGSLKLVMSQFYPVLGLFLLLSVCSSRYINDLFKGYAIILSILILVNTLFCVLNITDQLFGRNIYLIGIKNQVAISIIMCNFLLYIVKFNNRKIGEFIKILVFFCSTYSVIYIWSGNNVLAWLIFCLFFFVKNIKIFTGITIFKTIIIYAAFFYGVVVLQIQKYFRWIIFGLLKKDLTFSSRTIIWEKCLEKISEHPIMGYGLQESGNIIELSGYSINGIYSSTMFSAHNTILQVAYQNGLIIFIPLLKIIMLTSQKLKNVKKGEWKILSIFTLFSMLLIMFAENVQLAPFLDLLIIISNLNKLEEFYDT